MLRNRTEEQIEVVKQRTAEVHISYTTGIVILRAVKEKETMTSVICTTVDTLKTIESIIREGVLEVGEEEVFYEETRGTSTYKLYLKLETCGNYKLIEDNTVNILLRGTEEINNKVTIPLEKENKAELITSINKVLTVAEY